VHRVAASTAGAHHAVGDPRAAVTALDNGRALLIDGAPCESAPGRPDKPVCVADGRSVPVVVPGVVAQTTEPA
jgi:hypothetical protein